MGYFRSNNEDEKRRLWKKLEDPRDYEDDYEDEEDGEVEHFDDSEEDYWEEDDIEEEELEELYEPPKVPLWVRVAVWVATVAVFFAIGYWGSDLAIKWMDKKGYLKQKNVISTSTEVAGLTENSSGGAVSHGPLFQIYIPEKRGFIKEDVKVSPGLLEDELKQVLSIYIEKCSARGLLRPDVKVLHVFRTGDRLYLDMNASFLESLKAGGEEKAGILITSIVSTVVENFPPITKVKFLIEGKALQDRKPVDLSSFWAMPSS